MQNLNVDELLSPWLFNLPVEIQALTPSSLTLDSRAVKLNSMFVAIKGHAVDGRQFISSAIEQGASLILSQADSADDHGKIIYQDSVVILSFFELNSCSMSLGLKSLNFCRTELIRVPRLEAYPTK